MIKRLRIKLVAASMASLFFVLLVILGKVSRGGPNEKDPDADRQDS